jgi:hypothetical protein
MAKPIVYVDCSEIHSGKVEEVRELAFELVDFVKEREPRLLFYGFFFSEDERQMSVIALHPDSESMELHLEVAGPGFRKFRDLITMKGIDVYGRPTGDVLDQLRQKAQMLGARDGVALHGLESGFSRLQSVRVV